MSTTCPVDLADFERNAHAQWERDRQARIRRGACPRCGERLCPRVGGMDRECVTLDDLA